MALKNRCGRWTRYKDHAAVLLVYAVSGLLLAAGACEYEGDPAEETGVGVSWFTEVVCADGPTVDGIDVSYWQSTIDWDQVAGDGIAFAFIRVADGLYEDTEYDRNWSEARRVGVLRGTYQYFRPATDPILQADLLLRRMGTLEPGDMPPVIDVEADGGLSASAVADAVGRWIDHVETATGRMPIIYTRASFWDPRVASSDFSAYPLWVAHYGVSCPNLPAAWSDWKFHQTSSSGRVSGISGNVDTNVFNGDIDALFDFASATAECGDGFCNGDETPDTCPEDCPRCDPIPPEGRIVDETDNCFERGGNMAYWYEADAGWDGTLLWTHTTDSAHVDNYGVWNFDFEEAGLYRLEAYTDASWAQSTQAAYEVQHAGTTDTQVVNQSGVDGWNLIGDFDFTAGGDQWVQLNDNTGEPFSTSTQIVFDAVRLTRLSEIPDTSEEVPEAADVADVAEAVDAGEDMLVPPEHPDAAADTGPDLVDGQADPYVPADDTSRACYCAMAGGPA